MTVTDSKKYTPGVPAKILSVVTGAFLTGCLWRLRGEHGFGGSWGMLTVAAGLTLLIFALYGKREKITYEMLPVSVAAMSLTAGGWGTLNSQMAGFLISSVNFTGEEVARAVEINPLSGLFIMLCLGFGWMPLFSCLLGSLFSEKHYSKTNYLLLLGVYLAALLLFRASLSHPILRLASPEACNLFDLGLADRGIELSAYKAYMSDFFSDSFLKKIPGGRNYYASIAAISSSAAALVAVCVQRFVLKDKTASRIALGVNSTCAVAITAADFFLVIGYSGNIFHIYSAPAWLELCRWSMWEFFTGFFIGLGIMLIVALVPYREVSGPKAPKSLRLHKSGAVFAYSTVLTFFASLCLSPVRSLGIRLSEQIAEISSLPDRVYDIFSEIPITVAAGLISLLFCAYAAYKNIFLRRLPVPAPMGIERFSQKCLPVFFAACSVIYFFTGNAYLLNVKFTKITPSTLFTALREGLNASNIIMLISTAAFFALYALLVYLNGRKLKQK